jgi:D-alanine-D-alanine ligase
VATILLFGGPSREHLVSVATAQNLVTLMHQPACWFWSPSGPIHPVSVTELTSHQRPFERQLEPLSPPMADSIDEALGSLEAADLVVLGLHGAVGEDGVIQRSLEQRGIPFTGSGSNSSQLAFDKAEAKELLRRQGMPVTESILVRAGSRVPDRAHLESLLKRHGNLVLKPVAEGSSYGLHFASSAPEAEKILANESVDYLIEPFIHGAELTCGVVEMGGQPKALPSVQIRVQAGRSFDYAGKYLGAGTEELCPAEIPPEAEEAVRELALRAHEGLGCYGYSRSDFILSEDGPVFLETNTLPGLTRASLLPKELNAAGLSMREFLDQQILLAQKRYAR